MIYIISFEDTCWNKNLLNLCSIRKQMCLRLSPERVGRFVGQCSAIFANMATVDRLYALYNIISDAKDGAAKVS